MHLSGNRTVRSGVGFHSQFPAYSRRSPWQLGKKHLTTLPVPLKYTVDRQFAVAQPCRRISTSWRHPTNKLLDRTAMDSPDRQRAGPASSFSRSSRDMTYVASPRCLWTSSRDIPNRIACQSRSTHELLHPMTVRRPTARTHHAAHNAVPATGDPQLFCLFGREPDTLFSHPGTFESNGIVTMHCHTIPSPRRCAGSCRTSGARP